MTTAWQPSVPCEPKWLHLWMGLKDTIDKYRPEKSFRFVMNKRVEEIRNEYLSKSTRLELEKYISSWEELNASNPLVVDVAEYARAYVQYYFKA